MAYKITGRVLILTSAQTFKSKTGTSYTKRDLVIAVRLFDRYTGEPADDMENTPKFSFVGEDKCSSLDPIKVGDIVTVEFDITGRSYVKDGNTEYMTDVRPYRVYPVTLSASTPLPHTQSQQAVAMPNPGQTTAYPGGMTHLYMQTARPTNQPQYAEAPFPQNMQHDFAGTPLPGDEFR